MTKHTPGPWKAVCSEDPSATHLVGTEDGGIICRMEPWKRSGATLTERKPNAYLISASPELVGAVKNLLALFRHAPTGGLIDDTPVIVSADYEDEVDEALRYARAAIAKAEGRE
jgi:hypothetical protein